MLNVYTLEDYSVEPKVNSQFNDKIVECIPISVSLNRSKRGAPRDIETATTQKQVDYLFVLT